MLSSGFELLAGNDEFSLEMPVTPMARAQVLNFIRSQFMSHFGAEVDDDAPTLVGAFDTDGRLIAAFGLRRSPDGFFCERYLAGTVPQMLADRYGEPVAAADVVEVVHLCAVRPGFLMLLMPLLARALNQSGFRFLVCTATGCLSSFFARKGLPASHLGVADPLSLEPSERERWGRYYDKHPQVIAGDLGVACGILSVSASVPAPASALASAPSAARVALASPGGQ